MTVLYADGAAGDGTLIANSWSSWSARHLGDDTACRSNLKSVLRRYDGIWRSLDKIGIGKLLVQSAREREFANIYRGDDEARSLSDEEFVEVLTFTQAAFAMAMEFRARGSAG